MINALARRRLLSIFFVFFLSFGGSWLFSVFRGIPIPWGHDEFSYLLAADTFAHGRITNPTHPLWEFFDAPHVLQHPAYVSMHPPGQGVFLAAGQVLFGHPIWGVWLSAGLMCAAITWMFYALISPRWALIGGIIAGLQFGIFTYWSQSYWGGAVAGIGGALVFGALPRIAKYQRLRDALFLGVGIGILANTRPLEGILFGIPLGCLLLSWKIKWQAIDKSRLLKNVIWPLMLVVSILALFIGSYNKKITGNAFELPHVLYVKLYDQSPVCMLQQLSPIIDSKYKIWADYLRIRHINYYLHKRSWEGFTQYMFRDSSAMFMFYFGYLLALPAVFVIIRLFTRRETAGRYLVSFFILLLMLGMLPVRVNSYLFSPLACFAVLLVTIGLRRLFCLNFRRLRNKGALIVLLLGLQLFLNILLTPVQPRIMYLARSIKGSSVALPASFTREELKNILMKRAGNYLVIVHYPPVYNYYLEWVYNGADIDHSPVVWARDLGEEKDKRLLEYFKDRQIIHIGVYWSLKKTPDIEARA